LEADSHAAARDVNRERAGEGISAQVYGLRTKFLDPLDGRLAPIGRALARLHQVHDTRFGLAPFDGFFGPLPQDNVRRGRIAGWTSTRNAGCCRSCAALLARLPPAGPGR
jgi:hypothetical protein